MQTLYTEKTNYSLHLMLIIMSARVLELGFSFLKLSFTPMREL